MNPAVFIFGKLEQELPLVASMGDMPDLAGDVMSLCSGHSALISYMAFFTPEKGHIGPISGLKHVIYLYNQEGYRGPTPLRPNNFITPTNASDSGCFQ